ncbi:MAG: hypothetical protein LQ343_000891 [Gyalolechia ehrenbergii]|nr:MAG: hypothetical protein LQ343_000891 [Gyalolechia ehrenbergii]
MSTNNESGVSFQPTSENYTMMEAFEWYVPADQKHWQRLRGAVVDLKATGIDNLWIPPGCKGSSQQGNGYDIYDLYDIGEFDQKGGVPTKWGRKEELLQLVQSASDVGIGIYWDAVLNQKAGADHVERCQVVEVDPDDRTKAVTDPYMIDGWLGFDFPGRGEQYSAQKYHWYHFTGTDYNNANRRTAIYRILGDGKNWSNFVDKEKGNYDYLMFADIDYTHPEVEADVKTWSEWLARQIPLKGIRFDAIKHFSEEFLASLVEHLDAKVGPGWFLVGEFWEDSLDAMTTYIRNMQHKFSLFDAPLLYNFSQLSNVENADLTKVFDDTLVKSEPVNAVTLVMNHDTQPYQALAAEIQPFFKPLAYALILLRAEGYPCVFYGDIYGIKGDHPFPPSCGGKVPDLCLARKLYAYGEQHDYFNYAQCIGWSRLGTWDRPFGLACVMSNAGPNEKWMYVGQEHHGETWTDILGWEQSEVIINQDGWGCFPCPGVSVAVWVNEQAEGRDWFGRFDSNIYKE